MSSGNGSHGGRPASWIAVSIISVGFVVGGVALTIGPNWLLFWIGSGIVVAGGVYAFAVDIMGDVVIDEPRQVPSEMSAQGSKR